MPPAGPRTRQIARCRFQSHQVPGRRVGANHVREQSSVSSRLLPCAATLPVSQTFLAHRSSPPASNRAILLPFLNKAFPWPHRAHQLPPCLGSPLAAKPLRESTMLSVSVLSARSLLSPLRTQQGTETSCQGSQGPARASPSPRVTGLISLRAA